MLFTAWGKKDAETFKKNMTADGVQIGSSGVYKDLESILKAMGKQSCDMRNFRAEGVAIRKLSQDVVVLNYIFTQEVTCDGKKLPSRLAATSIYVQKGGNWLSTLYHESPIE